MNKEKLSIFLKKPVGANNLRRAIVTKGGDIVEIIDNDYKLEDDRIVIEQAKSQKRAIILYNVEILYINIDYLALVRSVYA